MQSPQHGSAPGSAVEVTLRGLLNKRILILDGAMGTMIQRYKLTEEQYRGVRFAEFAHDLKGNNELLCITQPHVIQEIHEAYLAAGVTVAYGPYLANGAGCTG